MAKILQSSGPISMSQIADEFIDTLGNNRLNEYGDGESGLTPQTKAAGTQRKFSDYYNREYKVIKELTNPDSQLPTSGTNDYYNLPLLFTPAERNAANQKILNVRDPGVPIGLPPLEFGISSADFGVLRMSLALFNIQGEVTINNYAKVYAPGGIRQDYGDSLDTFSKDGGNAITVETPAIGYENYTFIVNNYGELRGGGGAGAPGGKGGEGQYLVCRTSQLYCADSDLVPYKSIGTDGGTGGPGRGYVSTSPYYLTNMTGSAAAAATEAGAGTTLASKYLPRNAGTGGTGGSGGDWAQNGNSGSPGQDGTIETLPGALPATAVTITIGIGGIGGNGETNGGNGNGSTIINYDGFAIIALPGNGGQFNQTSQVNGAGQSFGVGSSASLYQEKALKGGNGGAASGDYGGGGGGAVNNDLSRSLGSAGQPGGYSVTSGEIPFISFGSFFASIAGDSQYNQNVGGSGGSTGSVGLNNAGGDALRWGSGGGGAGYYGGDGGNGLLGGGGGGAAGYPRSSMPCAFFMNVASTERWVRTTNASDLRSATSVSFTIVAANGTWGEPPDPNEGIELEYSTNGTTWVSIDYTDGGANRPIDWITKTVTLPSAAKTASTYLRYRQRGWSGAFDIWGLGPMYVKKSDGTTTQVINFGVASTYTKDSSSYIQFTTSSNYAAPAGFSGKPPQLFWTGGSGGSGAALVLFFNENGSIIDNFIGDIPGTYNVTPPTGTSEIYAWVVGPGGGGAGSGESDPTSGGGGGAGGHSFAWWKAVGIGNGTGANSTGAAGSTNFGLAGKAIKFENNRIPTNYTFNNFGTVNGATS